MFNNMNPYQQQMPFNPYQKNMAMTNQILRVNGIEGARAYQMMPNSMIALFDNNEDIFYIKTSDDGGFSKVKAYRFTEVVDSPTMAMNDFVTRKEFNELKEMISNGKQYIQQPATESRNEQSNANDAAI